MIIGFAGRARHGKDWTARHAQTLLQNRAVTRGFAVELKGRVRGALRGVPGIDEAMETKPTWLRSALQALGQAARDADQNFWVDQLFEWWNKKNWGTYSPADGRKEVLLIPDVRYPNEVAAIKARGGKVIKVVRWHETFDDMGAAQEGPYRAPGVNNDHPSEALLDTIPDTEFDAIFNAQTGETRWLELCIEERLQAWGLIARNDGGAGDDL